MRLNPDCVRDILLTVEDLCGIEDFISLPDPQFERLQKYSDNEVYYHVRQCELSGFLWGTTPWGGDCFFVQDLTPAGHEFLANIRKESVWNKTKETAEDVGSFSLNALAQIALSIVQAAIAKHLGLGG